MGEALIIRGAGNQRQLTIPFAGAQIAATHLLVQQFPAVFQRMVNSPCLNIFDTHRKPAFAGGNIRNPAAHQTATENADAIQWPGLRIGAAIFLQIRAGKEYRSQCLRLRSHRQLTEGTRFLGIAAATAMS